MSVLSANGTRTSLASSQSIDALNLDSRVECKRRIGVVVHKAEALFKYDFEVGFREQFWMHGEE